MAQERAERRFAAILAADVAGYSEPGGPPAPARHRNARRDGRRADAGASGRRSGLVDGDPGCGPRRLRKAAADARLGKGATPAIATEAARLCRRRLANSPAYGAGCPSR